MNYTIFNTVNIPNLPYSLQVEIGSNEYLLEFNYNSKFDFYTLTIQDLENKILYSTKVLYLSKLLVAKINDDLDPAKIQIAFADDREFQSDSPNYFHSVVDKTNFFQTVFPVLIDVTSI